MGEELDRWFTEQRRLQQKARDLLAAHSVVPMPFRVAPEMDPLWGIDPGTVVYTGRTGSGWARVSPRIEPPRIDHGRPR